MRLLTFRFFFSLSGILLTATLSIVAQSSTNETAAIRQTLMHYITNTNIGEAFHAQAQLKFVREHQYNQISANDFVKRVSKGPSRPANSIKITQMDIAGNAAFAKLESRRKGRLVTDYMSLLKIGGKWKIVSKVFSVQTLKDSKGSQKTFKHDGPVWAFNKMRLRKAEDYADYMECLRRNWAAARAEGKRQGYLNSYQILALPTNQVAGKSWNVLLITEYTSQQRMKDFEKDFRKIAKKVNPQGLVKIKGKTPRDFADIISYHILIDQVHSE